MADAPKERGPVESIPSIEGGISALASASAPFLFVDGAPNFGVRDGIVNITLEALRHIAPVPGQQVKTDRVVVAHLRMSVPAAQQLRQALDQALLLAAPVPGGMKN